MPLAMPGANFLRTVATFFLNVTWALCAVVLRVCCMLCMACLSLWMKEEKKEW